MAYKIKKRVTGFKTYSEARDFADRRKLFKNASFGYNKKQKHFLEIDDGFIIDVKKKRYLAPLNKGFRGWNTEIYKGYTLRFEKMKNGYYGVLAFKGGKPQVVSSGHHQYIGVGKTKREAIRDAKTSVDLWKK